MSDLYLTLRTRLEAVADWITLGSERMRAAQDALGLSDERVARLIPVATRTWIRWRQRGQVPVYMLERVADALDLEIDRPARQRITLDRDGDDVRILALEEKVDDLIELSTTAFANLAETLDALRVAVGLEVDPQSPKLPLPPSLPEPPVPAGGRSRRARTLDAD